MRPVFPPNTYHHVEAIRQALKRTLNTCTDVRDMIQSIQLYLDELKQLFPEKSK